MNIDRTGLSRRSVLIGATMAIGAGTARGSEICTPHCLTKEYVGYQDSPFGNQRCSNCQVWRPPHSCADVAGIISPNGWCKGWKQKA
jgi:hypothetical protein